MNWIYLIAIHINEILQLTKILYVDDLMTTKSSKKLIMRNNVSFSSQKG